ncbi:MAG TPA: RsmB/NOP family class I SAM-dependent RNA methyltransferase [Candidatus Pacearchaeota archaeon]|nr:RsmB/NOP family class I SAM-dependent RNA methyltransferase [Candidatus Pacearchaeota archaeon]
MTSKKILEPKPLFVERMQKLLGKDFGDYMEILKKEPRRSIRCNKLKISPEELKKRLEEKGWKIKQPFKEHGEIMVIESKLEPGELGRSLEHLLGYYYIQEIASMLPIIALKPKPEETVLDLCAAPGSKTTQMAAEMENRGTIISNEISLRRMKILASNLERSGVTNAIITKKEGLALCLKLKKAGFEFDKILVDAPCSGEGTLRSSPKTYKMWNIHSVKKLSRIQKNLAEAAFEILKKDGEMIYSTCTHSPEENEEIVDFLLEKFGENIKIEKISIPIEPRKGIRKWEEKEYAEDVKFSCRVYPQDNDTEGFFLAKFRRIG